MNSTDQSTSLDSSGGLLQLSNTDENHIIAVKTYVKSLLKSRIFLGRFIERRLTNQRIGYRDVVLVSAAEVELKRDLMEVQYKLQSVLAHTNWIGITNAKVLDLDQEGVCLWTEIDNQPFGPFWFQIKSVKFRDEETIVILKCLRHISDAFLELEPILTGCNKVCSPDSNISKSNITGSSLNETYHDIILNLKNALSISNLKDFVTFCIAFVIAFFTGSTAFVNFLGNFILALIREASIFVKNSTPLFLGFLDFLSKIVGGFYILMAMFFKPNSPAPNKRSINYHPQHQQQYDNRDFD